MQTTTAVILLKIPPKSTVLLKMQFASSIILFKIRSVLPALKQAVRLFRQVVHSSRTAVSSKPFARLSEPFARLKKSFIQAVCLFKQAVRSFKQAVWPCTSPVSNGLAIRSKIFISRLPVRASRSEYLISCSVVHFSRLNGLSTRFLPVC